MTLRGRGRGFEFAGQTGDLRRTALTRSVLVTMRSA